MTFGVLVQVLFDLILLAAVAFLWFKLNRPQKDDPRLSRGLQLLQSKIAVLEDLSDQVETQVKQISILMEAKVKDIQNQLLASDKQIQKIEASMTKSLEVAKIFQDRIPHQEIIERQNTLKYVKAARLAHQGLSAEAIAEEVDLSRGEIELIAKVNREKLQFSEEDLPEWVKEGMETETDETVARAGTTDGAGLEDEWVGIEARPLARVEDRAGLSLSSLGEKFRQNVTDIEAPAAAAETAALPVIEMPGRPSAPAVKETAQTTSGKSVEIQKVVFPRLDMTQHLS